MCLPLFCQKYTFDLDQPYGRKLHRQVAHDLIIVELSLFQFTLFCDCKQGSTLFLHFVAKTQPHSGINKIPCGYLEIKTNVSKSAAFVIKLFTEHCSIT